MAETFYPVYGWMPKELHIGGGELLVYAFLYSFTENRGQYDGGLQYMADQTGTGRRNVIRILQKLTEKKLIRKAKGPDGLCYSVCRQKTLPAEGTKCPAPGDKMTPAEVTKCPSPGDKMTPAEVTNCPDPGDKMTPNNKTHNNTHNKVDKILSAPVKNRYGEYGNVLLTAEELEKLKNEFPEDWQRRIERLSAYMASTGRTYKNHPATIRSWAMQDEKEGKAQPKRVPLPGGIKL